MNRFVSFLLVFFLGVIAAGIGYSILSDAKKESSGKKDLSFLDKPLENAYAYPEYSDIENSRQNAIVKNLRAGIGIYNKRGWIRFDQRACGNRC